MSSHTGIRKAYRFNGFDNKDRLSKFLNNVTKWEEMDTQFELQPLVGVFGLYKSYVIKDLTRFYNLNGRRQVENLLEKNLGYIPSV